MSCLSGILWKTFYWTVFLHKPALESAAGAHEAGERAVMLSSDIYLSNPISPNPYLLSPPPTVLQEQPEHLSKWGVQSCKREWGNEEGWWLLRCCWTTLSRLSWSRGQISCVQHLGVKLFDLTCFLISNTIFVSVEDQNVSVSVSFFPHILHDENI